MAKTITIRLDDDTYQMIRRAADGELRTISNFIEYATVSYLAQESFVSDEEMTELFSDAELTKTLRTARRDVAAKRYQRVR